jgi:hypothetical protein
MMEVKKSFPPEIEGRRHLFPIKWGEEQLSHPKIEGRRQLSPPFLWEKNRSHPLFMWGEEDCSPPEMMEVKTSFSQ